MDNAEQQKICILGCGGFIGSHLVEALLAKTNHEITGVDIASSKIDRYRDDARFTFQRIDVDDVEAIADIVEWSDMVLSLVAICNPAMYNTKPLDVIDINFVKPLELVKLCSAFGKRLIHFSTCEVYGKTIQGMVGDGLKFPEDPAHYLLKEDEAPLIMGPISAQRWTYAAAKQLLERVIYAYGDAGNLEYTIVRPLNFIGARMDYIPGIDGEGTPRVLACFMNALLFGGPLQLVDGGKARRTFTAIDDAVDGILRIIERREASRNQIFHLGTPGNECSIEELAHLMVDIFRELKPEMAGHAFPIESVHSEVFYGAGYEDCDRRVPDISKAMNLLDWNPAIDLREALRIAVSSFIEDYGGVDKKSEFSVRFSQS